ncbi:MAG: hypothetical protein L6Q68_13055 [Aquabacterium sp.]|nr:hypothetical protein [Aquabacterium sp.]
MRDVVVDEKAGTATISVRLGDFQGQAAGATATVQYTTRDATAIAGQDYTAISGTLVFAPGESVKTVVVDLQDDALREPLERFDFVLSQPVGLLLADGIAVIEIGASDGTPAAQPRLSVTDVTVSEAAGYADFVVSLHAPSSSLVTVNYANVNGSATNNADYRYVDGTLTFAPGETTKTVRVELIDNLATETTETFDLTLRSATAATLADAQATATVIDNDDTELMPLGYGRSNDIYDLPATAVTFIEAPDGGLDIVRSSISYTAPAHIEGVFLSGSAASATGNELANVLRGTAGNNTLSGLGGIDTAVFLATSGQATRSGTIDTATVSTPLDGTDTLLSIERLRFADVILASDTMPGGNTYLAYAMFNAGFNRGPDAAELGQWTAQLDMLGKGGDLAQAMINYYAPGVPNDVLVAHLWSTVVGTPIGSEELATYVGLIENGTYTQASLLELVATLELNTAEITGIVGQAVALDLSSFPLAG